MEKELVQQQELVQVLELVLVLEQQLEQVPEQAVVEYLLAVELRLPRLAGRPISPEPAARLLASRARVSRTADTALSALWRTITAAAPTANIR